MGGMGSGRRYQGGKETTDDCRSLDVRYLQRNGLLSAGRSSILNWTRNGKNEASIQVRMDADRVILDYRHQCNGSEWKSQNYPIRIEWTPCYYGGARAWFLCPANGCGKRVAKLYINGAIFACRHCYKLAYACQRETYDDRAARRADTIRRRLGWDVGILNLNGGRPKGMHYRTYLRLTIKHDIFVGISLAGIAKRFGMFEKTLGGISEDSNLFRKNEG